MIIQFFVILVDTHFHATTYASFLPDELESSR
jgi:hypothetical protein